MKIGGRVALYPALAIALIAGTVWRLGPVGEALLFGDELHSLQLIDQGYGAVLTSYSRTGEGLALPLLQRAMEDLFGLSNWTLRAPAWIPSLVLLLGCFPVLRPLIGPRPAAIATLLVAVNPLLIFYAHFARAYSLEVLLCFLLWWLVQSTVHERALGRRRALAIVAICAVLPWVHMTSLGALLAVGATGVVALWVETRTAGPAARLGAAVAAGTAGSVLLHLPARESVLAFVRTKTSATYFGSFDALDVVALLVGASELRVAAVIATVLAGLVVMLRERHRALPLLAACFASAFALWFVRPYGDAYAYARYAMPLVPPACVLWAKALVVAADCVPLGRCARPTLALAAGLALALGLFAVGPLARDPGTPGPHANTYMGMLGLPDFDRPWPDAPAFYSELAATRRRDGTRPRIIEAPALVNRQRHLYRSYWLAHRSPTRTAFMRYEADRPPSGTQLPLSDLDWVDEGEADFLILHIDVASEIAAYWRFVYREGEDVADGPRRAYMERHSRTGEMRPFGPGVLDALVDRLGEPVYRDRHLVAWQLGDVEFGGGAGRRDD